MRGDGGLRCWQSVGITVNRFRFTFHNDEDRSDAAIDSGCEMQVKLLIPRAINACAIDTLISRQGLNSL